MAVKIPTLAVSGGGEIQCGSSMDRCPYYVHIHVMCIESSEEFDGITTHWHSVADGYWHCHFTRPQFQLYLLAHGIFCRYTPCQEIRCHFIFNNKSRIYWLIFYKFHAIRNKNEYSTIAYILLTYGLMTS